MRSDDELKALAARMLASDPSSRFGRQLAEARVPPLLSLPPPRQVAWQFMPMSGPPSEGRLRLLERGELVWAIRLEGEPRPYEESGADPFTVGFRHPRTGAIELRRFRAVTVDETEGMTLVFPLVLDVATGDALPWSFFHLDELGTEVAAGLAAPPAPPPPVDIHGETRAKAAAIETLAMQKLQEGDGAQALTCFVLAADLHLQMNQRLEERRLLSSAAFLSRQLGDLTTAVELVTRALRYDGPLPANDMALASFAGVLDRAQDRRAASLWRVAAESFDDTLPLMRLVCQAHAIGADLARGVPVALPNARAFFAQLGPSTLPSHWAGYLGAVGDSANAAGLPFLAQAAWVMARESSAWNESNAPFWWLLIERAQLPFALSVERPPASLCDALETLVPPGLWMLPPR